MWNLKILPYKMGSESAKELAELLDIVRVKPNGNYIPKHLHNVINWGFSGTPDWAERARTRGVRILNKPSAVNIAVNKLSTFQTLTANNISIPKFTTDVSVANSWLQTGHTVVERHDLRGNSGSGIRIVNLDDPEMPKTINRAPLYTQFINKQAEFRVHVFNGEVIDYIEKRRVSSERRTETFNKYISSINFGWAFCRTGIREIPEIKDIALKTIRALGLDFGAVDVIYFDNKSYVLEVNCSPGLAGNTLVKYGNAIRKFMGQPDLPLSVTQPLMDTTHRVAPAPAAQVAQVESRVDNTMHEMVSLRMTRGEAMKLSALITQVLR